MNTQLRDYLAGVNDRAARIEDDRWAVEVDAKLGGFFSSVTVRVYHNSYNCYRRTVESVAGQLTVRHDVAYLLAELDRYLKLNGGNEEEDKA